MLVSELSKLIFKSKNFLCVGLDSDFNKLPGHLLETKRPVLEFNKRIIDATSDYCVSYKLNTAFYEARGVEGWADLEDTLDYIPKDKFVIADAKRGDIGNTAKMYAKSFFEHLNFDALTINPYMGLDTIESYASYTDKTLIVLGLTSNQGSKDFEQLKCEDGEEVYQKVMKSSSKIIDKSRLMFVVGATNSTKMESIRKTFPEHYFLVPGIGAQGGNRDEVAQGLINSDLGILVNSSRGIIFSDSSLRFAESAREKAKSLHDWMQTKVELLNKPSE